MHLFSFACLQHPRLILLALYCTLMWMVSASADVKAEASQVGKADVSIGFERYELPNGLDVILHVDRSDPIAAVSMTFHVGSAREVRGKTGFAHLFEHLFFLDSENLGPGGLDKLMTRLGSATQGTTNRDRTNYYQVVPIDGLEKTLWAEADKLGFFINTVSESVVAKEKQIVKNEKRQAYDNRPYGHTDDVIDRALHPAAHPYSWQVIGSLADIESASLADVVEFHRRWYGPNNATLVVAGDIDVAATKAWIQRYFGDIPAGSPALANRPPAIRLQSSPRLVHADRMARLPMLTMAWPTVPLYHPDQYPLDILAALLTDGKNAPFYKLMVEEAKVAPAVQALQRSGELAGRWDISVRAFAGMNLDRVHAVIEQSFARFEREGVQANELARIKAKVETGFHIGLSSVLGKSFQLAQYNIFAGDPGFAGEDLRRTLAVSTEDVMRVYRQYIRGRHHVTTSFVPRDQPGLALRGSAKAVVVEEPIVIGAEAAAEKIMRGERRTPSTFDRSVEPPFGKSPSLKAPAVWRAQLDNGLAVLGIEDHEVPLVQFELRLRGGALLDPEGRVGVANLLAESMMAGTVRRTPAELEQAIDLLGASIKIKADRQSFSFSGAALARNFDATMALLQEMLLEPRFDADEFKRAQQRVINRLQQEAADPASTADQAFQRLLYEGHRLAENPLGTAQTVPQIGVEDLRRHHAKAIRPSVGAMHVSGAIKQEQVVAALERMAGAWKGEAPALPKPPVWSAERAGLYFVDVPGAAQSVLRIGYPALAEVDADFHPATVMNFRLGGGGFASELTLKLREGLGYTYGIESGFSGTDIAGPFQIAASVRSNVSFEALREIKGIVERHGPDFSAADLEITQGFLLRANAMAFETRDAKLSLLAAMSSYGFPADYLLRREQAVREMSTSRIQALARRYLDPAGMVWLVVGDARTQLPRLKALGLGEVTAVDRQGRRSR